MPPNPCIKQDALSWLLEKNWQKEEGSCTKCTLSKSHQQRASTCSEYLKPPASKLNSRSWSQFHDLTPTTPTLPNQELNLPTWPAITRRWTHAALPKKTVPWHQKQLSFVGIPFTNGCLCGVLLLKNISLYMYISYALFIAYYILYIIIYIYTYYIILYCIILYYILYIIYYILYIIYYILYIIIYIYYIILYYIILYYIILYIYYKLYIIYYILHKLHIIYYKLNIIYYILYIIYYLLYIIYIYICILYKLYRFYTVYYFILYHI